MSGCIEADHGERGRGDDETEEIGEFGGHGGGVVMGEARGPQANCSQASWRTCGKVIRTGSAEPGA